MRWTLFALMLLGCPAPVDPTLGGPCTTELAGRCDSEAPRLLQCLDGGYQLYADCHGTRGCSIVNDTADCDTSGNSVGDHCAPTSEGKVRCDPDGGANILLCSDGGLHAVVSCTAPTSCALADAGLACR